MRAPVGHAATQAGSSMFTQASHLNATLYSAEGRMTPKEQNMTHIQHPQHISVLTEIMPVSASRLMAPLGQALRQRADSQCLHCKGKLRFESPTTVTFAAGFGFSLTAPKRVLEKEPRPTAHAISQVLQPKHFSLSTQIRLMTFLPFMNMREIIMPPHLSGHCARWAACAPVQFAQCLIP